MSHDGLEVVLTMANHDFAELHRLAQQDLLAANQTSDSLDDLEARLALFSADEAAPTREAAGRDGDPGMQRPSDVSWEQRRARAEARLRERGVDPAACDVDLLLDPAEVSRIERRSTGGYDLAAKLDRYDLLAVLAAGIAATAVDALVVRIPRDIRWQDSVQQGSWVTGWLRDHAVPSDNWLADLAKVPYDRMQSWDGISIPGMSSRTHRVQTFGHDPLLGLVMGTIDIMRGTITGASPGAGVFVHESAGRAVANPFHAFALQVMHLLSDLPTRAGLPVPGWAMMTSIAGGSYKGRTIDEWSRLMYVRGYDTWHFMSMSTVPATVHLVLRAYWALRQELDDEYAAQIAVEAGPLGDPVSGHPRFDSLLLGGHAVAAGGNIAKLVAYGGNPLALNYNQWLAFLRSAFQRMANSGPTPSERLATQSFANASALDDGWIDLARTDIGAWPRPGQREHQQ